MGAARNWTVWFNSLCPPVTAPLLSGREWNERIKGRQDPALPASQVMCLRSLCIYPINTHADTRMHTPRQPVLLILLKLVEFVKYRTTPQLSRIFFCVDHYYTFTQIWHATCTTNSLLNRFSFSMCIASRHYPYTTVLSTEAACLSSSWLIHRDPKNIFVH